MQRVDIQTNRAKSSGYVVAVAVIPAKPPARKDKYTGRDSLLGVPEKR